MNRKFFIKTILLFFLVILIPLIVIGIEFYITSEAPALLYDGDKTVSEEDIVCFEEIIFRDLRIDKESNFDNEKQYYKYYILRRNHFSSKINNTQLSSYCINYFNKQSNYDKIYFYFYSECGTMPWFWNSDGFFPDLEMNEKNKSAAYVVTKDKIIGGTK